jgi:uncharacterized membrane protein
MATMSRLAPPLAPLVLGVFVVALGASPMVAGQTEPPPAGSAAPAPPPDPPLAAPAAAEAPPVVVPPAAPVPAAAPAPALLATPGELGALPPPEEHPPLYKETWFWAVVGVAVLTATMITIGIVSQGPETPKTDLGNMRAF